MGKKLIIKGADFSENGMREAVVTVDKSALYTYGGTVQVTSENLSSLTQADASSYMAAGANGLVQNAHNNPTKYYANTFDAEDYKTISVSMVNMPGFKTPANIYGFGIGFANENNRIIKAYGPTTSEASGDWYVKVASNFSGDIDIPEGTKYIFISDIINDIDALAEHSVVLKKLVLE